MEKITFDHRPWLRSSFFFKENNVFIEKEDKPSKTFVILEEELDGLDIDYIGNFKDLLRLVFINEKYGNLKVELEGEELPRNINKKKKQVILQA